MESEKDERPSRRNQGPDTKLSPAFMSELRKRLAELGRRLNRAEALSDRRAAARTIDKASRVKKKETKEEKD